MKTLSIALLCGLSLVSFAAQGKAHKQATGSLSDGPKVYVSYVQPGQTVPVEMIQTDPDDPTFRYALGQPEVREATAADPARVFFPAMGVTDTFKPNGRYPLVVQCADKRKPTVMAGGESSLVSCP
jgi:hypothetical protein